MFTLLNKNRFKTLILLSISTINFANSNPSKKITHTKVITSKRVLLKHESDLKNFSTKNATLIKEQSALFMQKGIYTVIKNENHLNDLLKSRDTRYPCGIMGTEFAGKTMGKVGLRYAARGLVSFFYTLLTPIALIFNPGHAIKYLGDKMKGKVDESEKEDWGTLFHSGGSNPRIFNINFEGYFTETEVTYDNNKKETLYHSKLNVLSGITHTGKVITVLDLPPNPNQYASSEALSKTLGIVYDDELTKKAVK